jgi:hypothetical protein
MNFIFLNILTILHIANASFSVCSRSSLSEDGGPQLRSFQVVPEEHHHLKFDQVACIARDLPNKAGIETFRAFTMLITVGLSAISYGTMGCADHWAVIFRSSEHDYVWYTEFGDGDVKFGANGIRDLGTMDFRIWDALFESQAGAENHLSEIRNKDGIFEYRKPVRVERSWKDIPKTSLGALRYMKEHCECSKYQYRVAGNNCQHYGCELYHNDFPKQQRLYDEAKERGETL